MSSQLASTGRDDAPRRPRMLIFSFTDIANDGRVLRQVKEFAKDYEVTTYGNGDCPHPGVEHLTDDFHLPAWAKHLRGLFWRLKLHRLAYWVEPDNRRARKTLRGREFDVVIANDLSAVGVIASVAPRSKTLLDLHEYWLGLLDDNPAWVKVRAPYYDWLLRKYGSGMASYTVVSNSIAKRYYDEYGFECKVVANSSVYRDFEVQPVHEPMKLVHSGAAKPARKIEVMMKAVAASKANVTFDLYLTGVETDYYKGLERLAAELNDERIRLVPPVPHSELLETLSGYDVGLPFLPPTTTNLLLCLPNKFFDYVQARLGILTGPTEAMAELVDQYGLGLVTESFEVDALTRTIDSLTPETVKRFKENSHAAACDLAGEPQLEIWREELERIVAQGSA